VSDAKPPGRARTRLKKRPDHYHHGDLRRALVQETLRLIEEQGVAAVSLREVARRLRVTAGAPYHHFPDKVQLLAAVAEEGFVLLLGAIETSLAPRLADGPVVWLRVAGRAYVEFATAHEARYRTMFLPEFRERDRFPALHASGGKALEALVAVVSQIGPPASPAEARARGVAIWSAWHGFALLANNAVLSSHPDLPDGETLLTALLDLVDRAASSTA
jgi:AcrR family transcriptional regulator